jgi:hypothetical protein
MAPLVDSVLKDVGIEASSLQGLTKQISENLGKSESK